MSIKRKFFEKSLFLHRKIAKRFGIDIVLNKNNSFYQPVNNREPIVQDYNLRMHNQVFSKKHNEKIDINKIDIAFIVPEPIKGSGGHRNFYRAIKYLHDFGHELTVYYTQTQEPADIVKQKVSEWFYDMTDIPYVRYEGKLGYHDVCVATWWETAYSLNENLNKISFPFYFVQDFEPAFYPICSNYILAENSYKLGFSHICSGKWCKDFLISKYNAEADSFQFPVDTSIYNTNTPRTKKDKNIIFFAKPDLDRRCYELGILALNEFHKIKPDVEIILFGSNWVKSKTVPFPATYKLLLPTLKDLAYLYQNADLGLVFSTTNPSLVPYEMLSCGCPVADLDLEQAVSKYGGSSDRVFLCNPEPKKMAKQLADIIDNTELRKQKSEAGKKWVLEEFPSELQMAHLVEQMIKNKIEKGNMAL